MEVGEGGGGREGLGDADLFIDVEVAVRPEKLQSQDFISCLAWEFWLSPAKKCLMSASILQQVDCVLRPALSTLSLRGIDRASRTQRDIHHFPGSSGFSTLTRALA